MAGLLYKDFVAVHGKIYTYAMLLATLFLMAIAVFPVSEDVVVVVSMLVLVIAMMLPVGVNSFSVGIFNADEGFKKHAFLLSLPISKKQYVASKYIFLLISYYVVLSVSVLWAQLVNCAVEEALQDSMVVQSIGLLPLLVMACVVISGVELPFFVAVGVKAGNAVKTCMLALFGFAVFGYMFFGDLTVLERFSLEALLKYAKEHTEILLALQSFGAVLVALFYYLSYRIACMLYIRKEPGDDA